MALDSAAYLGGSQFTLIDNNPDAVQLMHQRLAPAFHSMLVSDPGYNLITWKLIILGQRNHDRSTRALQ